MANLLLQYGTRVNDPPGQYGPVLVAATVNNDLALIKLLLDIGAEIDASHRFGAQQNPETRQQTALSRAICNDYVSMVEMLHNRGADFTIECVCGHAIQNAAYFGRSEILGILISYGADIHKPSKSFLNVMEAAMAGAQGDMFPKFLGFGMDIHVKCPPRDNLLHIAAGESSI
jgi:ankyrin repeat protein